MDAFFSLPAPGRFLAWVGLLAATGAGVLWFHRENPFAEGGPGAVPIPLPEFPTWESPWIGSDPLTRDDLLGEVWIVELWTFECINCIRSMPFLHSIRDRYGSRVHMLGIHAPEFEQERDLGALREAIARDSMDFPVLADQTLTYFTALDPPGWPTFYLVDRRARIRGTWSGEMHPGSRRAGAFERLLRELIAEPEPSASTLRASASPAPDPPAGP